MTARSSRRTRLAAMVSPHTDRLLRIREVRRTVIAGMRPGTADDPAFIMKRVWIFLVGPRRVLVVRERALAAFAVDGMHFWHAAMPSSVAGACVVASTSLCVVTEVGELAMWNVKTAGILWRCQSVGLPPLAWRRRDYPKANLLVAAGVAVVLVGASARELRVWDGRTGAELCRHSTEQCVLTMTYSAAANKLYGALGNGLQTRARDLEIRAWCTEQWAEIWRTQAAWASSDLSDLTCRGDAIFATTNDYGTTWPQIFAWDANGALMWQRPTDIFQSNWSLASAEGSSPLFAVTCPIEFHLDAKFEISKFELFALDVATGQKLWHLILDVPDAVDLSALGSPHVIVASGTVYLSADANFRRTAFEDGADGYVHGSVVIALPCELPCDADYPVTWRWSDAADLVLWQKNISAVVAAFMCMDDSVYIGTRDGRVCAWHFTTGGALWEDLGTPAAGGVLGVIMA